MQPGYPGPSQDPNNQNPSDPFAQPGYGQMPNYSDPYQQPQQPQQPEQPQQPQQPQYPQYPEYPQAPGGQAYPGQPYGAPQYPDAGYPGGGYTVPGPPPGAGGQNNTLGLLGMILGILSIPLACCNIFDFPVGVAGLVLSILGMRKANAGLASNRGMALAGVICSVVGLILMAVVVIVGIASHGRFGRP